MPICEATDSMQCRPPNEYHEVSNTNHFGSVSDSLGRLAGASECMASIIQLKIILSSETEVPPYVVGPTIITYSTAFIVHGEYWTWKLFETANEMSWLLTFSHVTANICDNPLLDAHLVSMMSVTCPIFIVMRRHRRIAHVLASLVIASTSWSVSLYHSCIL